MRHILPESQIHPTALATVDQNYRSVVEEVSTAVGRDAIVVVGMAQNPHVKRARKALKDAGVQFTYLEYGSYVSDWRKRTAIKMWTGWPTFPMVFAGGFLVGGASETITLLGDGSLQRIASNRTLAG
jgi:monothiol glutaredoxin